jgi:alanine racemase
MSERSRVTIDLAAIRHNVARLRAVVAPSEVWAVVKADAYGHGAADVGRAALTAGAGALCVATVEEGVALREAVGAGARIVVMGPASVADRPEARAARLELVIVTPGEIPTDVPVHLKLDTGMGRWGLSELIEPGDNVVGLMTHFAASEADEAFTRRQLEAFLAATAPYPGIERHAANSAAALTMPEARLDAVRCGIAVYGIDPFGVDGREHGLRPALRWESAIARVVRLEPGESTGYGRRFVADRPTWIGQVPVGYADGFVRHLTGTKVMVGDDLCEVVGTISMDALAVRLPGRTEVGASVTLVGDGVTFEQHARVAGTIAYELACSLRPGPARARRVVEG